MKKQYLKPEAQLLDRSLAVSIGGCAVGNSPGTCGLPGTRAGTCSPTGTQQGVLGRICTPGDYALTGCSVGNWAEL